ncbi:tetratricopeptide repeat protein [Flavobacterium sp.]|uniref:tetratricopeptide repeat-containing sensor histidine kinase n=1 Tax=Flavobacterium sp. TaxID=239 RepID=UPI0039E477C0
MNKRIFLIVLLMLSWVGFSQNPAQQLIDSLKTELRKNPAKIQKAKLVADLAWYYNMVSIDSAMGYGKQSIGLAKELKDPKMIAQALSDYGAILYVKGDYDRAMKVLHESYGIRKKIKDEEGIASLDFKIGNVYLKQFELEKSMDYYLRSLKYYEKAKNAQVVGTLETNIAAVYHGLKNYPKALEYLRRSEKYLTETKQESMLANTIVGIGNVYFSQNDTIKAFVEFERAAKLAEKVQNYPALTTAYNNLGLIYTYRKKPKMAIDYITKSLAIRQQINQTADVASSQLTLAINYNNLGQFAKAKPLLLESLKVFTQDSIREKMGNAYIQLIPVYASLGKVDSVNYYTDKYLRHAEHNLNESVLKISNELETKYQTEKKEKLLLQQQAETRQKNVLLLLVSIFAVFIALIGYLIYRQQRLKNRQQEQEHELKLAISKIETQNKLQEQRLSISRDLHDNIGAQLTFIISSVDNIKYGFNVENQNLGNKLDRISNFTKSTIVELRDTIWAMNSNAITFKDLELRIMNFIEKAKKAKEDINFKFEIADDLSKMELTSIVGMNLYRTIQEAVNNAIKYAEASQIAIQIASESNLVKIKISDDGNGFDTENADSGNGLLNMKKRIKDIGGTYELQSEIGKGTMIQFSIPKK